MDLAAWEPGQAAGLGARPRRLVSALPRGSDRVLREHRPQLWPHSADPDEGPHDQVSGHPAELPAFTSALGDEVRGTLSDLDGSMDRSRRQFDDSYSVQPDRLGASYLAGLAAGPNDNDWVQWFQTRISAWNNLQVAAATRAQLEQPGCRAEMQRLPPYWVGEKPPHVSVRTEPGGELAGARRVGETGARSSRPVPAYLFACRWCRHVLKLKQ